MTDCDSVVFVRDAVRAKACLSRRGNRVIAAFPFISALGVRGDPNELRKLSCVERVSALKVAKICEVSSAYESGFSETPPPPNTGGKGVTVAVIDTGVSEHLDLCLPRNRIKAFVDFVGKKKEPYDDNGHGTLVCGIIAGNGIASGLKHRGVAYNASVAALKAVDASGEGNTFTILSAMQWVYDNRKKYDIKVVNVSLGSPFGGKSDPLLVGAETLWKSGVTVVASAGNDGPKPSTVLSPAASPVVIGVGGASLNGGTVEVPSFSSRGPGLNGFPRPDLIAPAVDVISLGVGGGYVYSSGTSMSAPKVSALVAAAYELLPSATPDRIKELLISSAVKIGDDPNESGYGLATGDFLSALKSEIAG